MSKKQKTKNTKLNSIKEKLRYIRGNCKETETFWVFTKVIYS